VHENKAKIDYIEQTEDATNAGRNIIIIQQNTGMNIGNKTTTTNNNSNNNICFNLGFL